MTSTLDAPVTTPAVLDLDRLGPGFGVNVRGVDLATADDADDRGGPAGADRPQGAVLRRPAARSRQPGGPGQPDGPAHRSHPVVPGLDEAHAEIYSLDSADNGFADMWHTDVTFVKRPPLGSILRAVTLPPYGGDTNWADLELAFASLSEPVQRLAEQLTAVHDGTREFGYYLAQRRQGEGSLWEGERFKRLEPIEHPVVRVHPETGRKSLFVNPGFVSHIAGVSDAESRHLLDLFYAHITKPEHIVRHRWQLGDVAMWDNRATVHYANRDYGGARRVMHRITLRGDEPVGVGVLR